MSAVASHFTRRPGEHLVARSESVGGGVAIVDRHEHARSRSARPPRRRRARRAMPVACHATAARGPRSSVPSSSPRPARARTRRRPRTSDSSGTSATHGGGRRCQRLVGQRPRGGGPSGTGLDETGSEDAGSTWPEGTDAGERVSAPATSGELRLVGVDALVILVIVQAHGVPPCWGLATSGLPWSMPTGVGGATRRRDMCCEVERHERREGSRPGQETMPTLPTVQFPSVLSGYGNRRPVPTVEEGNCLSKRAPRCAWTT